MAILLGPSGFGIVYQFLNYQNLIASVSNLGSPVGLTTFIPQNIETKELIERAYKSLTILVTSIVLIFTFISILFSDFICSTILGIQGNQYIFILIILSTPLMVAFSIAESYLKGYQNLNLLLKITVISSSISIIVILPLLYYYKLLGVSIYYFVISLVPLISYIYYDRESIKYIYHNREKFSFASINKILKIGVVSLLSSSMFQFSLLQIRKFIIVNFDINLAGIYQSLIGLSSNYFLIIFTFISYYTLPKVSGLKKDFEIQNELNIQLRFLMFIVIPMILIVLTFRSFLIELLYSKEFLVSSDLYYFQLLGDFVKSLGALFGIWLIPRMKFKVLFCIDITFNLLFIFSPYILYSLIPNNLVIIPLTYFISFSIHFLLVFLYTKYSLNFKFNAKSIKILFISIATLSISFIINIYYQEMSYYLIFMIILLNSYFVLDREELNKIKLFLRNYNK